ncbi:MAG: WG repeat-containing protein [Bacteroidales bacterium]|nr:WG repeat-containing protein [Bacteroidales bacterium]
MKILVDSSNYDYNQDDRLLIPFYEGGKWGLCNKNKDVVLPAQYDEIRGCCKKESDLLLIVNRYTAAFLNGNKVSQYEREHVGVVNSYGEIIIPPVYYSLELVQSKRLAVARKDNLQYGVIKLDESIVVPYGKYHIIYSFYQGYARVMTREKLPDDTFMDLWGIINTNGTEVLPVKYKKVWNFVGKNRNSTRYIDFYDVCREFVFPQ